jgi:hypothetical protein
VPLEFRGLAIMDPPGRGVRFAGYPTSRQNLPMVICEVSAEALRAIGGLPAATYDELMGIFELHKKQILAVASAKFDAGEHRPIIAEHDFAPVSN